MQFFYSQNHTVYSIAAFCIYYCHLLLPFICIGVFLFESFVKKYLQADPILIQSVHSLYFKGLLMDRIWIELKYNSNANLLKFY